MVRTLLGSKTGYLKSLMLPNSMSYGMMPQTSKFLKFIHAQTPQKGAAFNCTYMVTGVKGVI